ADDKGAEERGPEAADVKSQTKRRRKRAREPQHQAVDDERKQAEREENQRKGKNFRERPQRGIDDSEDQRHAEKRQDATSESDAGDDARRHPQSGSVDEQTDEKRHLARTSLAADALLSRKSRVASRQRSRVPSPWNLE